MGKYIEKVQRLLKNKVMRFASMLVILMSISCVILSSFEEFQPYGWLFQSFIHLASLLFLIEYVLSGFTALPHRVRPQDLFGTGA